LLIIDQGNAKKMISKSVGRGGVNHPADVRWVQERLNNCNAKITVSIDGVFSPVTAAAIDYFQGRFLGLKPTGLVIPSESTAIKLSQTPMGCWAPKDMLQLPAKGTRSPMLPSDFVRAAGALNVELATLKAVASVESIGSGFDSEGRPVILYEPHLFSRLTNRKYDEAFPLLSSSKWNKALYNQGGTSYEKLEIASALDRSAAFQACSWGIFQILGMNYKLCGFPSVDAMVQAIFKNEREHLLAFVRFLQSKRLDQFLRNKDWAAFAHGYNGPLYKQNRYDETLQKAYKLHVQ
jgi:hypothetical protein